MWNHSKSLILSYALIKGALILWCVLIIPAALWLRPWQALVIYGGVFLPILTALLSLDGFLREIRRGAVFVEANIQHLRRVSWGCFFAGVFLLVAAVYAPVCFFWSGLIGFFGLLMRVVKNMLAEAIALKAENDYTI